MLIIACLLWEIYDIVVPHKKENIETIMSPSLNDEDDDDNDDDTVVITNEHLSPLNNRETTLCETSTINTSRAVNDLTQEPTLLHYESNVVFDDDNTDNVTDNCSSVDGTVFRNVPSVDFLSGVTTDDINQDDQLNHDRIATTKEMKDKQYNNNYYDNHNQGSNDDGSIRRDACQSVMISDEDITHKIMNPLPSGCELNNAIVTMLSDKYPVLTRLDIVRFLVARKGKADLVIEMIDQCLVWRSQYFPLTLSSVSKALLSPCFFIYDKTVVAKDGTPIVFMRGGLYDNRSYPDETPLQYVLLAAHSIEALLRLHPNEINVTVIVHTIRVEGGANVSPDLTFIKLLIKVQYLLQYFAMMMYRIRRRYWCCCCTSSSHIFCFYYST
jgi:hypothetical protein